MSWYQQGDATPQDVQQAQRQSNSKPHRFWLGENSQAYFIVLDAKFFSFHEHNWKIANNWRNWETCPGMQAGCPECISGRYPHKVFVVSIIDLSVWKDKRGNERSNQKKVLALTPDQAISFQNVVNQLGGMQYRAFLASRGGKKSAMAFSAALVNGQIWQPDLSVYQRAPFDADFLQPFDYLNIYAPATPQLIESKIQQSKMSAYSGAPIGVPNGLPPTNQGVMQQGFSHGVPPVHHASQAQYHAAPQMPGAGAPPVGLPNQQNQPHGGQPVPQMTQQPPVQSIAPQQLSQPAGASHVPTATSPAHPGQVGSAPQSLPTHEGTDFPSATPGLDDIPF